LKKITNRCIRAIFFFLDFLLNFLFGFSFEFSFWIFLQRIFMELEPFVVICPHCGDQILIEQLNCRIFRHGVLRETGQQIPPHSDKSVCDELVNKKLIFGCGKPFMVTNNIAVACDYI
jgi:hypothetical protein